MRIIAATNRDLSEALEKKEFREDLYYRLNVIALTLPPLRERREDVVVFADHFLNNYAEEMCKRVKRFSDEALDVITNHDWPGNIRELENAIERAVILCNGETIRPEHLMLDHPASGKQAPQPAGIPALPVTTSLRDVEKVHIERVLKYKKWNQSAAAKVLGVDRKTLRSKIREFKLEKDAG